MRLAGLLLAAAAIPPSAATADTPVFWHVGLGQSGGWADNVLSTTTLDPAIRPTSSAFYEARPEGSFGFLPRPNLRLSARYQAEIAVFGDGDLGVRQWHRGQLGARLWLGDFALYARVHGAGYRFGAFPTDSFGQLGGQLLATWARSGLWVLLSADATGRFFLEPGGTLAPGGEVREDTDVGGAVGVGYDAPVGLGVSASWSFVRRFSLEPVVDRAYHTLGVRVGGRISHFRADLGYAATLREATTGGLDVYHSATAELGWQLTSWLELAARYRVAADRTAEEALGFTSHEVALGVRIAFGAVPRPLTDVPMPEGEPTPIRAGVRFRTRRRGARAVSVVGDFNDWDPAAAPMAGPDREGRFELVLPIAAGRYEYQYCVDGRFVSPKDGVRLRRTGFGEPNGVLVVEEDRPSDEGI